MMPRCGEPFPERPASTCTRKPGHDPAIGHQVYCRDRLYVWHATPPPLFLPLFRGEGGRFRPKDGQNSRFAPFFR